MTITNTAQVLDSRDVIHRIEALEADDARTEDEQAELASLKLVAAQAENYGDWEYGAQLISDSYFTSYITDLIDECYEDVPPSPGSYRDKKNPKSGWPYRHIKVDYEAAAAEAKFDYMAIDFDGVTYWMQA